MVATNASSTLVVHQQHSNKSPTTTDSITNNDGGNILNVVSQNSIQDYKVENSSNHRNAWMTRMLPPNRHGVSQLVQVLQQCDSSVTNNVNINGNGNAEPKVMAGSNNAKERSFSAIENDLLANHYQHGIISYPCESSYMIGCNARCEEVVDRMVQLFHSEEESSLLSTSSSKNQSNVCQYSMHVSSADVARGYFAFQPCRKYAYRKPLNSAVSADASNSNVASSPSSSSVSSRFGSTDTSSSSCSNASVNTKSNQQYKMVYCKLSEGREVFERLAEAFWPGALTIMAKTTWKCVGENHRLLFHSSLDNSATVSTNESKMAATTSMSMYVGIRCPSHPLAQCILKEAKVPIFAITAYNSDTSKPLLQAVHVRDMYSDRIGDTNDSNSTELLSDNENVLIRDMDEYESSLSSTSLLPMYVLNGEDKREIFTVSTCELAGESTVIKIDETRNAVIILREGVGPSKEHLKRALYRLPTSSTSNGGKISSSQLITTALLRKKWKVVDSDELLSTVEEEEEESNEQKEKFVNEESSSTNGAKRQKV